ncbi:hypothetical protein [Streptomyces sp. NPDC054961]
MAVHLIDEAPQQLARTGDLVRGDAGGQRAVDFGGAGRDLVQRAVPLGREGQERRAAVIGVGPGDFEAAGGPGHGQGFLGKAGVVWYDVDLDARTCTYYGADGDHDVEAYPAVEI